MYRAIFLFDIADLVLDLSQAARSQMTRAPQLRACPIDSLIYAWIYEHLWTDMTLALLPTQHGKELLVQECDATFLRADKFLSDRLYRQINLAFNSVANPYYECWCSLDVTDQSTLSLTFDMGPVDFSTLPRRG